MKAALFIGVGFPGTEAFHFEFVQESALQTDGDRAAAWSIFQQDFCLCPLKMDILQVMHLKCPPSDAFIYHCLLTFPMWLHGHINTHFA